MAFNLVYRDSLLAHPQQKKQFWRFHMRHLLLLSILLLGTSWAMAQNDPSQTAPTQTHPSQEMSASSGTNTSVQGCLSGSDGNFMLTDKNGTTYQLTGDTAKLSEHVGHEVKVMGSTSSASSSGAGTPPGAMGETSKQSLQVSSIKHISKTCQSGGGMSH